MATKQRTRWCAGRQDYCNEWFTCAYCKDNKQEGGDNNESASDNQ